jgi:hypothetical protein
MLVSPPTGPQRRAGSAAIPDALSRQGVNQDNNSSGRTLGSSLAWTQKVNAEMTGNPAVMARQ